VQLKAHNVKGVDLSRKGRGRLAKMDL
jgi:hypothetical protein